MSLLLSTEGVGGDDSAIYVVWHFMVVENPEKIRKDLSRLAARWHGGVWCPRPWASGFRWFPAVCGYLHGQ